MPDPEVEWPSAAAGGQLVLRKTLLAGTRGSVSLQDFRRAGACRERNRQEERLAQPDWYGSLWPATPLRRV